MFPDRLVVRTGRYVCGLIPEDNAQDLYPSANVIPAYHLNCSLSEAKATQQYSKETDKGNLNFDTPHPSLFLESLVSKFLVLIFFKRRIRLMENELFRAYGFCL